MEAGFRFAFRAGRLPGLRGSSTSPESPDRSGTPEIRSFDGSTDAGAPVSGGAGAVRHQNLDRPTPVSVPAGPESRKAGAAPEWTRAWEPAPAGTAGSGTRGAGRQEEPRTGRRIAAGRERSGDFDSEDTDFADTDSADTDSGDTDFADTDREGAAAVPLRPRSLSLPS